MTISRAPRRTELAAAALLVVLAVSTRAHALVVAGPIVNPANGNAYFLLSQNAWSAAEDEARTRGGHLVAIGGAAENAWVWSTFSAITSGPFWIGLTDVAQEGTFVWTNGEPTVYTSWWTAGGEPNNTGGVEHFVEINNGLWNDNTGAGPFRGIVEAKSAFGFVEAEATPPPPSGFAGVTALAVSGDGNHVYAIYDVSPGDDPMLTYARGADGALTLIDAPLLAVNPNAMALSPDDSTVFVATNNGALQAFHRNPATGLLSLADQVDDGSDGGTYLLSAYGVAVSPDGKNVYVAGGENAVTSFAWDGGTGTLTLIDTDVTGTGGLLLSAPGPLAVTPDGAFVLVVSQLDKAFVVLARNAVSGTLDFVERFVDGVNLVDGLDAPTALAVAPTAQGAAVYVSSFELMLAVFSETLTGPAPGVSFVETVPVSARQTALAVSPDGTRIYVVDRFSNSVSAYERDPDNGNLGAVVAAISDGDPGVDGLAEARAIAASPDGRHLYVAGVPDHAIAVLTAPAPEPGAVMLGLAALLTLSGIAHRR